MYVHIDYGCGFLPERREVVERAVHVVEARRRLARECVERPVHRRERGRGDFRGLRVEFNLSHAPREVLVRVGDRRLGADGATAATRRGFGFFAHELIKRATLSRGMSSRFLPYGPASSRSA